MTHNLARELMLVTFIAGSAWAADARNGAEILRAQNCLECHTIGGQGIGHEANATAPDLTKRLTFAYTPSSLASVLWNHTPAMWEQMSAQTIARPAATKADWQDVFAYLYSVQFFEYPAEVGRGKQVLESKHCVDCHALSKSAAISRAAPVSEWRSVDDPVMLVYQMWNHSRTMVREAESRRTAWPQLSGRDFKDITAYVQDLQNLPRETYYSLPDGSTGKELFASKCDQCHQGGLATALRNKTWMDIGAGMWNHAAKMRVVPAIESDEMRKILAYVWELQYNGPAGNPERGHKAFNEKRCIACHKDSAGTPQGPRPGIVFTPYSLVMLGWGPGRQMHREMSGKGIDWPYLSPADVSNLVAYLNTLSSGPVRSVDH